MKSYNHLFEQYLSDENYELAVKNATAHKGGKKRKYRNAQFFRTHKDELKAELMDYAEHFHNESHKPKLIYDGVRRKQRMILIPSMREQIVHHMIVNVMKPIIMKSMYQHSYGSVPGRGAIKGKKRKHGRYTLGGKDAVEKFIRKYPRKCKYCCKMDIHKFFDSVPHDKLKSMFTKIIHDERFLAVLHTLVDANGTEIGLPIGFYTSQWFSNFYLTGLDHYIKETLGAKGYFRYMDDMVVFDGNKRRIHWIRAMIEEYLRDELGLKMNPKWQVFRFHYVKKDGTEKGRFLDFMGFRFYRNRTTLRRSLMLRDTRKAKKIGRKKMKTIFDCRQMLSYKGWLTPSDTYGMYRKRIKPYVSFRYMRQRVAIWQKIENRKEMIACGTETKTGA